MSYRPYQRIERRKSRQIHVGRVPVGGDAPITVQTMTNTLTSDPAATITQVRRAELAGGHAVYALPIEGDGARGDVEEAEDGLADGRFAAAGLADEGEGLAAGDLEGDAVHGIDVAGDAAEEAGTEGEVLLEVVDFQDGARRAHAARASFVA